LTLGVKVDQCQALALPTFILNVFVSDDVRVAAETCSTAGIKTSEWRYFCCAFLKVGIRNSNVPAKRDWQFESYKITCFHSLYQVVYTINSVRLEVYAYFILRNLLRELSN
jgi:hypothetical protein